MRWRVTITHTVEGSVEMSEPEGLVSAIIGLTRHPTFHTLVKEFKSSFRAYGSNGTQDGRRDWIKNIEALYGPDAVVSILIEYAPNNFTFEELYSGEIGIQTIVEGLEFDHYLEFTPVQNGMWRKFISRYDVPVNIQSAVDLDGNAVPVITPETLNLLSQIINFQSKYTGHSGDQTSLDDAYLATTSEITLSGHQLIDGTMTTDDMRILVKDQSDQTKNGVFVASAGAWTRSTDANTGVELDSAIIKIVYGSVNSGKTFKQYTNPVTIDVSPIFWQEYNYVSDVLLKEYTDPIDWINYIFDFYLNGTVNPIISEIEDTFTIPVEYVDTPNSIIESIEIKDGFGDLQITADIDFMFRLHVAWTSTGNPLSMNVIGELYIQKNEDTPILIDGFTNLLSFDSDIGDPIEFVRSFALTGSIIIPVKSGDRIKIFAHWRFDANKSTISGTWHTRQLWGGITSENVLFEFRSKKLPSTSQSFLIHDVAASIMDRITDVNKFYSEYIGSQYTQARSYLSAGPWWNNMLFKGVHARGYTLSEKIFSLSFKDLWEGLEPMFNLSLGYETVEGEERIVMRSKAEAYDSSSMSVLLSGVQKIKRKYGPDYFNGAKFGANKGKTEDINGLDDPHSRTIASILKNIGRVFTNTTNFIYQSLTIEQARRTTKIKSADYKFDDDIFIVEATRTASNAYQPRLNEDFVSVTNLNNEAIRYNKHHTPARFMLRWMNYISGGLQKYIGTVFRFTGGEGNYDMVSTMINGSAPDDYGGNALAENADIIVGTTYLWVPKVFEIEHYLTFEEFKTIDQNRNIAIGVSQSYEGHKEFFIDDLQFEIMSGQVKITGKFKEEFDIITVPPGGQIFQGGRIFDATFDFSFE